MSSPKSTKFVREYFSYNSETREKKIDSRWHYDLNKQPYGPILVEEFNLPRPEKKKRKKKVAE
jgi:hypothetical protein